MIFLFLPGGCSHSYLISLLLSIWRHFPPYLLFSYLAGVSLSPWRLFFFLLGAVFLPVEFSLPRGNFSPSLEPVFLSSWRMFSSQPGGCFHPNLEAFFLFGGCFPTCQQFLSIAGRSFPLYSRDHHSLHPNPAKFFLISLLTV